MTAAVKALATCAQTGVEHCKNTKVLPEGKGTVGSGSVTGKVVGAPLKGAIAALAASTFAADAPDELALAGVPELQAAAETTTTAERITAAIPRAPRFEIPCADRARRPRPDL
ncbi:hypothetical protein GCM10011399_23100 [Subtercola lobariae]|uniref:Uncharacterized protein n=1 Tax=Subtercola lobariae TaxID=1588641 RepID=A0A917EX26_9MICO|nr:hypothetical protein GCM10011399_23100 [Subtercola lobariae]